MAPQSPKIFFTGITGFLGGQLIIHLLRMNPKPSITALVRQESQATKLSAVYPSVRLVIGGLDSHDLLVEEASKADIVIQAGDGDHQAGILSLTEGVARGTAAAAKEGSGRAKPVLFQTSGSANLVDPEYLNGVADPNIWSDRDDMQALRDLPHTRLHVAVENAFLAAAEEKGVQGIILAPGVILGRSESLFRPESYSAVAYQEMVKYGQACVVGEGGNTWGWVSVKDTSDAIVFFVEEALKGQRGGQSRLEYGWRGYYFVGTGDVPMLERSKVLAKRLFADGKFKSDEVEKMTPDDLGRVSPHPFFPMLIRSNSRYRAHRMEGLGWKPKELDWKPLMEEAGGERM